MYLREMGGVELLSREGEIAIAKRIEAGKDVMINALTQSPLVGKKIFDSIIITASGKLTKSELNGYGDDEFNPWIIGATM